MRWILPDGPCSTTTRPRIGQYSSPRRRTSGPWRCSEPGMSERKQRAALGGVRQVGPVPVGQNRTSIPERPRTAARQQARQRGFVRAEQAAAKSAGRVRRAPWRPARSVGRQGWRRAGDLRRQAEEQRPPAAPPGSKPDPRNRANRRRVHARIPIRHPFQNRVHLCASRGPGPWSSRGWSAKIESSTDRPNTPRAGLRLDVRPSPVVALCVDRESLRYAVPRAAPNCRRPATVPPPVTIDDTSSLHTDRRRRNPGPVGDPRCSAAPFLTSRPRRGHRGSVPFPHSNRTPYSSTSCPP